MDNKQSVQICFIIIITICSILLFIPKMIYRPGLLLSSIFFIAMANLGLCISWLLMLFNKKMLSRSALTIYLFLPFCLIISSLFYLFNVIIVNKQRIQEENVHPYYQKYMIITLWLICAELLFCYYLFQSLSDEDESSGRLNISIIIFFCILSYFITRFNSIYFTYFSADG